MREFWGYVVALFTPHLKAAGALIVGLVLAYWNGAPQGMRTIALAAISMFIIDTICGSMIALRDKKFSSRCFGRCLSKLSVYGLAVAASIPLGNVLALSYAVTTMVLMLIFIRESTSCLECLSLLGFPLPEWITTRLKAIEKACEADPSGEAETCGVGDQTTEG